jgi:formyltetrahydrofolate deformylase
MATSRPNSGDTATLLISCPDHRGIVAEVTHFIFTYSGNILHSDQHNDDETGTFFMRIEWDLIDFTIRKDKLAAAFEPIAEKFGMEWGLEFSTRVSRMALFVSRFDHCLWDLMTRWKSGELDAEVVCIISNHPDTRSIAEYFEVPFYHIPVSKETRAADEARQWEVLDGHGADLIVLARYMQILSHEFVERYRHRIINIHHSFLPAFIGAKPYHQAYSRGVKIIGATSHYVTAELDQGPIIEQDVARISHRDTVKDLVQKGRNLEKMVLSRAVRLHLDHKVLIFGNKTVIFD